MLMKVLKVGSVIFGAVLITALTIDASDTLSGRGGTMLAGIIGTKSEFCPVGMKHVQAALTFSCVDEFELAAKADCPVTRPQNQFDTEVNISKADCLAASSAEGEPWRYINREQAAVMCARSAKRLPTATEWYQFSLGTPTKACNIVGGGVTRGDTYNECVSAVGVRNAVGNLWEWVTDDVINGVYQGRDLPPTGYVIQVDNGGVATVTEVEKQTNTEEQNYFWMEPSGSFGMIRGGFYGSRSDAGVFTLHAHTAPTFTGAAIGFRCVQ